MKHALVLSLLIAMPCMGQTKTTGEANTAGPCSPAVTGNNNQFKIICQGLTKEQVGEFSEILNKIANRQLDPKLVMNKLDEIENEVKKANSGVWSGYDFHGVKRTQSPGRSMAVGGQETNTFRRLAELNASKDWNSLKELAEKQIKETPDWPTPYFFSGLANAQLGHREIAVERLETFLSGADDRLDYQKAVGFARELLAQLQGAQ